MQKNLWQNALAMVAGVWLAASPWVLNHTSPISAMVWNVVIVGAAIVVHSAVDFAKEVRWQPVVNLLLGLWAIASPWALGFAGMRGMMYSTVAAGAVIGVLSAWQLAERFDIGDRSMQ